MSGLIRRCSLTPFFVIAFAIPIPLFALYGSGALASFQILLLILGSSGPAIAAVVVARVLGVRSALRYRIARWRLPGIWYLASVVNL